MDSPQGLAGGAAESPGGAVHARRDLGEAGFQRAVGKGQESRHVAVNDGDDGAAQQKPRRYAQNLLAEAVQGVVEPGQRDHHPDGENGAGNRIADAGKPGGRLDHGAAAEPGSVGQEQPDQHRQPGGHGREAETVGGISEKVGA